MNKYPAGSQWRKWDLHVHVPGTKLNDAYEKNLGLPDFDRFADNLENSDVSVIGITDYFSADQSLAFIQHFKERFPDSEKLLLVNVELRLNETVNRDVQMVDFHVIFRDSIAGAKISEFLSRLTTQLTDRQGRQKPCSELAGNDFNTATVTRAHIKQAFRDTFGEKAEVSDYLIFVAPANNNGFRAQSGQQRKANIADEIDKDIHAVFGKGPENSSHFLLRDRYEDTSQPSQPKPVFGGCDAHSFADLEAWLGNTLRDKSTRQVATWVKADPTFAGLQQTLIEPAERVALQAAEPDQKEPYKVISKVRFSGTDEFPHEVSFNRNLNAIIGSRSSGKSALLAYMAHAVDPAETLRLQVEAHGLRDAKEAGPAAGLTWAEVAGVACKVEWASGEDTIGKVIYIPQNALYKLSEQPEEITKKIAPALFRIYPLVKTAFDNSAIRVAAANSDIRSAVGEWFGLADRIDEREQEVKDLGDKAAIATERDRLQGEIDRIKTAARLSDDEVRKYQAVAEQLDGMETRVKEVAVELDQLGSYVAPAEGLNVASILPQAVQATVTLRPSSAEVPESVAVNLDELKANVLRDLVSSVEATLVKAVNDLDDEEESLRAEIETIRSTNADLIEKHEANAELSGVVEDHKKQVTILANIAKGEKARDQLIIEQVAAAAKASKGVADRAEALSALVEIFSDEERLLTDLTFGIETDITTNTVEHASIGFNQRSTNAYIKSKGDSVAYESAHADPAKFLQALRSGEVALNKSYEPSAVAADVLTVSSEVRFSAELDSDRIGGFRRSSMTPGKQALFALTLILNESQEPWPLLIDQPEDDLDSRSIYDTIVPYLVDGKKERQIIMVSHNANLVIGADSEQIIVANRHGDDRKNKNAQTFEYFTGALEHSQPLNASSPTALGRFGVREHACEVLDGGEEAFQKRRNKYKIQ
ncbi:hypothetical protein E3T25_04300 [Cryobacterium sandaracinum]|uniref:DNA repair protein n=1 Tax=Cryobacterium sandaracinum TaxID=1259247 RepID=A0ABY2JGJ0_9MICO|nr:hypothetical protein [Cryobacterium sandaracinum]TFD05135.1 hypothetical protein E3T25_04300 [Cryobacterium sandaracinum]